MYIYMHIFLKKKKKTKQHNKEEIQAKWARCST